MVYLGLLALLSPALAEDICNGQNTGGIDAVDRTNACAEEAHLLGNCRSASEESQTTTDSKVSDGAK